jgi:hypothetical protein
VRCIVAACSVGGGDLQQLLVEKFCGCVVVGIRVEDPKEAPGYQAPTGEDSDDEQPLIVQVLLRCPEASATG